ncbi:MAG: hypothetical protein ACE5JV_00400 [Nitrososphaerales archaeon]
MKTNNRTRHDYDYNKPVAVCITCSTLASWHCYDCGKDFCPEHFNAHKANNMCNIPKEQPAAAAKEQNGDESGQRSG